MLGWNVQDGLLTPISGSSAGLTGVAVGWPGICLPTWLLRGGLLALLTDLCWHSKWTSYVKVGFQNTTMGAARSPLIFEQGSLLLMSLLLHSIGQGVPMPAQIQREEKYTPSPWSSKVTLRKSLWIGREELLQSSLEM